MMNLPPEIIQIIFLKLCSTRTIFPLQNDPRLMVTHVCSQWRAIALGMPYLWANLRIPINFPLPYDHIRAWISRSAPSPLFVRFCGPIYHSTFSVEMLDLIIPEIQRCAYLKLSIDVLTFGRLLTLPPGSLRTLRSISIKPTSPVDAQSLRTIPRVTAFQQCPRLRHVSFEVMGPIALDLATFELPWNQLTHLGMHSCVLREYETLDVLRQCTALQQCSISTSPASVTDVQRIVALTRPIVLPRLHTLHLGLGDPWNHSIHFVHTLRLPRLRSLRLAMPSWRPCPLLPLFRPILSETVHNLDLSGWTTMELPAALALMPNLKTLKFNDDDAELLQALGGGAIGPRLVTLRVGEMTPGNLLDMLEARVVAARANSSITAFSNVFAVGLDVGNTDAARLAALRATGMQLVFKNSL